MQFKPAVAAVMAAGMLLSLGATHAATDTAKKPPAKSAKAPAKQDAKESAKKDSKKSSEVITTVAPPSGQWEGKPPPADGWVWSAGFYEWKDGRYQWKAGEWILDKPGMDYRQHQWVEAGEGKWKLIGGDWVPEKHASN